MVEYSIVEMQLMEVTHPNGTNRHDASRGDGNHYGNGDFCFFAGAGFDSLMLHDFQQLKAWSRSPASRAIPAFVRDSLSSVAGYCVALVTRTLPQTLRHGTHRIHVEVTTGDEGALWVDHRRGDFAEPAVQGGLSKERANGATSSGSSTATLMSHRRQHLLYSGFTGIVAASTTPYYGGGMRLFPYARLFPGRLQLRLGRISPLTGVANIFRIFSGSYRDMSDRAFGCLDFIGREFEVRVSSGRYEEYARRRSQKRLWLRSLISRKRQGTSYLINHDEQDKDGIRGSSGKTPMSTVSGFPFQHSGESMGIRERFKIRVVQEPVKFVSFLEPRVIVDD